jgi:hypothetical protein
LPCKRVIDVLTKALSKATIPVILASPARIRRRTLSHV